MFGLFKNKTNRANAKLAKERLLITVAHQRADRISTTTDEPPYMRKLKVEILEVVRKYIPVDWENIETNINRDDSGDILALNIILPKADGEYLTPDSEDFDSKVEKLSRIIKKLQASKENGGNFDIYAAAEELFTANSANRGDQ
ncbi:MAG: cell division topological specificity factor MinE [Cardiobacteriaceae bacterium]|nr:cell division topological specificity factor MinE [Cardiobacteriaceae bacterium]